MATDDQTALLADAIGIALRRQAASQPAPFDMAKIEEMVKRVAAESAATAATAAVTQTLISLGIDPAQRMDVIRDLMFLRDMRTLSSDSKKHVLLAVMAFVATGMVGALWIYAKSTGKVP